MDWQGWLNVLKVPVLAFLGGLAVTALTVGMTGASKRILMRSLLGRPAKERRLGAEDYLVWKDLLVTSLVGTLTLMLAQEGRVHRWQIWGLAVVVVIGLVMPSVVQQYVYDSNGEIRSFRAIVIADVIGVCALGIAVGCGVGGI